ncbi:extracellular solute-binding protein [Acholeplasma manati]|uniref:Extracellular solute-binding protein n=1 Tax=Paracholeplasma manati TaxID=591373 RepID=A0ABT2Y472_9MOLU|nr:extracellular solute-binding protein [Paracholeplasma manati]MCV2231524.1 extracellular solute-binding protein [Paracholeplasma manati]
MKTIKKITIVSILLVGFFIARALLVKDEVQPLEQYDGFTTNQWTENKYSTYRQTYDLSSPSPTIEITPAEFDLTGANLLNSANARGYGSPVIELNRMNTIRIEITVNSAALYQIYVDYMYIGTELFSPKFGLTIDGEYPFYEARQLTLPIVWQPDVEMSHNGFQAEYLFQKDRYNNDVQPRSENAEIWLHDGFYDASFYTASPLEFYLSSGTHIIVIESRNDGVLLGNMTLLNKSTLSTYDEYIEAYSNVEKYQALIQLEAEFLKEKSDPSIKLFADKKKASTPTALKTSHLNAIDAYTWDEAGRSVSWDVTVPKAGLYQISFKYIQYRLVNISSFRTIKINGEIPFEEMTAFGFPYAQDWKNVTLGNEQPYWFYFNEGVNNLSLTATIEPYKPILETIETVMKEITQLSIEIQQLTGGNTDAYRDWDLVSFIPDISSDLNLWADELESAYRYGHSINHRSKASAELLNLKLAYRQLRTLAQKPNQIPNQMTLLSEGSKSVAQYLGDILLRLSEQPLGLEKIYLSGDQRLPRPRANFFENTIHATQLFFLSFNQDYVVSSDPEKTIDVWVNRPRANIDLMQKMIDELYTRESGIHVNLSLMPNPTKLILSNAANIEPDVAMGVSSETPYNFAIRNAAQDLRIFEGYEALVSHFAKGSMIPYVYEDGVYGLPETQDFYVTYYRTDIFSIIESDIPDTWQEVTALMPQLRRMGMNYYVPLSSSNAYKSMQITAPFYYQNQANLYQANGIYTDIDSTAGIEAMRLMTELFTIHDLPIATANFYNNFRYGLLPIGISNSSTYLQLMIAAPEIKGNWNIALYPGVVDPVTNEVLRYSSAPTSATMIFKSSDKKEMAFDFLSWWHSTEIQTQFSNDIQKMFGKEYMWFSSNLDALASLPIDINHKSVILEQLNWAVSAPNVPGGYYLEREISNAWNKIVISDQNLRSTVDEAIKNANRELERKMAEFGYVQNGVIVKTYPIPTLSTIDAWLKERDSDG